MIRHNNKTKGSCGGFYVEEEKNFCVGHYGFGAGGCGVLKHRLAE